MNTLKRPRNMQANGYTRSQITCIVFFCSTCEYCGRNIVSTNKIIGERLELEHRKYCQAQSEKTLA